MIFFDKEEQKEFGSFCRKARMAAGIGVAEVRKKLGLSQTAISRFETGDMVFRRSSLAQYAKAIGMTQKKINLKLISMLRKRNK